MSRNAASTGSTDPNSINTTSIAAFLLPGTVLDFPSLTHRGRELQNHFWSLGHELGQEFPYFSPLLFWEDKLMWLARLRKCWLYQAKSGIRGWVTLPKLRWWGLPSLAISATKWPTRHFEQQGFIVSCSKTRDSWFWGLLNSRVWLRWLISWWFFCDALAFVLMVMEAATIQIWSPHMTTLQGKREGAEGLLEHFYTEVPATNPSRVPTSQPHLSWADRKWRRGVPQEKNQNGVSGPVLKQGGQRGIWGTW